MTKTLSPREQQIADLVALCHPNKQIGERLFITEATVKVQLSRIYRKLGFEYSANPRVALAVRDRDRRIAELEFLLGHCGEDRTAALETLTLALKRAEELGALFKNGIGALVERAAIDAAGEGGA